MKLDFSGQIFKKYSNTIFHENPSSGSQVVPCGQMDKQTDMMKLIAPFHSLANMPKTVNGYRFCLLYKV